jgi:type I restriction enzyme S subunit
MSFPRYPRYKASGVEWLGEVPAHWGVMRLKAALSRNDGGVWGDEPTGLDDTIVLRSTDQTVDGQWQLDDPASRHLKATDRMAALLENGDLLLTKSSGSAAHIGKTTLVSQDISDRKCCFSNFMQRLRVQADRFLPRLAWYLLNSQIARTQFEVMSNTTTGLANLSGGLVGDIFFGIPPIEEQVLIVAFLDGETSRIDALKAEQQRLIELLKEKRQAVISHAVTKGLDPNAKMKPSGIEWLGDVPAHWDIVEIRKLAKPGTTITYGIVQAGPDIEGGIPYIRTSDMSGASLAPTGYMRTTPEIDASYARSRVEEGDLVVAIRASLGKALLVPAYLEGANLTQGTAKISPGTRLTSRFLLWVFNGDYNQISIRLEAKGTTFLEITLDSLRRLPFAIPPLHEQVAIADHIEVRTCDLDALMESAERAVVLLQERRTALISAAVTGQIDVRSTSGG